jgi:hypothetical protein
MFTARSMGAAAAVASVLVLSACGASASDGDFLDQGPRRMAKTALTDTRATDSMRVLGSQENDLGFVRVDIRLNDTDCEGRLITEDGDVQLLKNAAGAWYRAEAPFWRAHAESLPNAQRLARHGGLWIAAPEDDELLELCDLDNILADFRLKRKDGYNTIKLGQVEQVSGVDAVALHGRDGKQRVTAWVALDSPHRVLKMALTNDTGLPDELVFSSFGDDVEAASPDPEDIAKVPKA